MSSDRVYGFHVIETLLKKHPERVLEVFIQDSRNDANTTQLKSLAQKNGIFIQAIKSKELDRWFPDAVHQGIAARVHANTMLTEADLPEYVESTPSPLFLILDGVQDPHNLGAVLRTAEASGATGVIIPKSHSVSVTPTVRKIASGAAEVLPIFEVANLARVIETLKKLNVWIVGTDMDATQTIFEVDLKGSIAIVLGAEGSGLRRLTKDSCDFLAKLPMQGVVESLNVSVTAGICLYESLRQRCSRS